MKNNTPFLATLWIMCISMTGFAQPAIDGYNVYYGDLHNHCNVSDGQGTINDAYNYAKNVSQLDFFGLSDHSNLISATEWTQTKNTANSYNEDGVFAAFYGFEWTTYLSYGHVTIVNTDDYCSNSGSTSNFAGLLNWVNTRNCMAFFNHPGWEFYTYYEFDHFTDSPSSKFVGMELWNTQSGFSTYYYNDGYYSSDGNKGYFDEALIRNWKIGAAGGDDNHTANWGNLKPWRTGVLANVKTRNDIFNAYQERRIFSTLDKTLVLSFKVNGFMMGSTILGGNWNAIINAFDQENEVFTKVDLLKNGVVIYSTTPNATHPIIIRPVACADGDYFYIRVKQADGDEAISSPVFISGLAQAPQVAITSPENGAVFTAGSDISVSATASDIDGTISRVEFYEDGLLFGQDSIAPYTAILPGSVEGDHILTAKAFDNLGLFTTSVSVSILVNPLPVLIVTPGNIDITSSAGTTSFAVNSNLDWTVLSNQPWCVVTPSGSGNGTIAVEYEENMFPAIRVAEITVTATGLQPVTITLSQAGSSNKVLSLTLLLQGLYNEDGLMNTAKDESGDKWGQDIADKITVELHNGSDYSDVLYIVADVDLHTNGMATIVIPAAYSGSYYITVKHRNSITIVSAFPVSLSGSQVNISFDEIESTFGNCLLLLPDGHRVMYGGDVNQDGLVDAGDLISVDNGSRLYLTGYLTEDINGDGLVDSSDLIIVDNNASTFVAASYP
jgi:hypothetical protein